MRDQSEPDSGEVGDVESEARSAARMLRARGGAELFTFLALAAADGRWGAFIAAFSEVADISGNGVEVLLEQLEPSLGWTHLYHAAGLPRSLFNFFLRLLDIARHTPLSANSYSRRCDVLAAVRCAPEAVDAPVPEALWKSLSSQ
jgi:hypothetical protein